MRIPTYTFTQFKIYNPFSMLCLTKIVADQRKRKKGKLLSLSFIVYNVLFKMNHM